MTSASNYFNHSWFYGTHEDGNGKIAYFSYFSEFNRKSGGLPYFEAVVFSFLFVISLLGNSAVLFQMCTMKSTRTVTNCMISNLALADILFSTGGPFIAVTRISGTWILGEGVCKLLMYFMFLCATVMIWTMTIISIDRYICIIKTTSKKISPKIAMITIILMWLLWFMLCIPFSLYFHTRESDLGRDKITICTISWPITKSFLLPVFVLTIFVVVGFVIPILIMTANYFRIIRKFLKTRRAVMNNQMIVDRLNNTNSISRKTTRGKRDVRVIKTLLLMVFLFFLMWLPICIAFVAILADGMFQKMKSPSIAFIWPLSIALANACVNPFIYGVMNDRLRRAVLICICCRNRKVLPKTSENSQATNTRCIHTISQKFEQSIQEHTVRF